MKIIQQENVDAVSPSGTATNAQQSPVCRQSENTGGAYQAVFKTAAPPLAWEDFEFAVLRCQSLSRFSFLKTVLEGDNMKAVLEKIAPFPIVEIGYGKNPLRNYAELASYVGVDPFEHPPEDARDLIRTDGLSFLRTQADRSAVVVSFGVLDRSILGRPEMNGAYWDEICREIRRVSYPYAVLVWQYAEKCFGKADIPSVEAVPQAGGLYDWSKD